MLKLNIEDSIQDQILREIITKLKDDNNFSHISSGTWEKISKLDGLSDDQILKTLSEPSERT